MRIGVDRERCCSSGMCALTAPEVFEQAEDDGRVLLLTAEPPPAVHDAVREAIEICPSGAIFEDSE